MIFDQAEFDIRCEWGQHGVSQLAGISDASELDTDDCAPMLLDGAYKNWRTQASASDRLKSPQKT